MMPKPVFTALLPIAGKLHEVVLCCPGDWHRVKRSRPDGESWSTIRMGVQLIAISPPYRAAPVEPVTALAAE